MRFALDVDGVLADFSAGFVRKANQIWPARFPQGYEPDRWDWDLSDSDRDQVWKAILADGCFWYSLPAYHQNVRAVAMHQQAFPDDEIFYVTNRPDTAGWTAMRQTATWLVLVGIMTISSSVITTPDDVHKSEIYQVLGISASLDDKPENVRSFAGHKAYLLDRPWNRDHQSGKSVVSSVEEYLSKMRVQ